MFTLDPHLTIFNRGTDDRHLESNIPYNIRRKIHKFSFGCTVILLLNLQRRRLCCHQSSISIELIFLSNCSKSKNSMKLDVIFFCLIVFVECLIVSEFAKSSPKMKLYYFNLPGKVIRYL